METKIEVKGKTIQAPAGYETVGMQPEGIFLKVQFKKEEQVSKLALTKSLFLRTELFNSDGVFVASIDQEVK